jgi:TfoX/Sxy family transcriptional regulator of competence genes
LAYDEMLAGRIRKLLQAKRNVIEKKMFGGLAFMLNGHMCCGVEKNNLVIRVGPEKYNDLVIKPHARPMDLTGRPLKGFIYVEASGYKSEPGLRKWLDEAVAFVASQPAKPQKTEPKRPMKKKAKKR